MLPKFQDNIWGQPAVKPIVNEIPNFKHAIYQENIVFDWRAIGSPLAYTDFMYFVGEWIGENNIPLFYHESVLHFIQV